MDTLATIRALVAMFDPHFTSGGSFLTTGERGTDCLILAASYARTALDGDTSLADRIVALRRAGEECALAHYLTARLDSPPVASRELVQNAIAWATVLICDEARELCSKPARKRAKAGAT